MINHSLNTNYNYQLAFKNGNADNFNDLYDTNEFPYPQKFRYNTNYLESPPVYLTRHKFYKFIVKCNYSYFNILKTNDVNSDAINIYKKHYVNGNVYDGTFIINTNTLDFNPEKLYYGSRSIGEFEIHMKDYEIEPIL